MINRKKYLIYSCIFLLCCLLAQMSFAQNIGINTTGAMPDSSAILDISSTEKGILIPRMDSTARNNIATPAKGLMVFESTYNSFMFYNGATWAKIEGAADNLGLHTAEQNIQLNGNFISQDGNNKGVLIDSLGRVGVLDRTIDSTAVISGKFYIQANPIQQSLFDHNNGNTFLFDPFWQSFASTKNGASGKYILDMVFGAPLGTSNYELYAGEGTGGTLLYSGSIANSTEYTFGNVIFQAGQIYTLNVLTLANGGGVYTQHFGINPLAGGRLSTDPNSDISGSFSLIAYDPGFQVHDTAIVMNNYRFPVVDGAANQILVLDHTGKLNWQDQVNTDQQDLARSGNTLSVTNDATPVDLSGFMDNTDNQDFSLTNDSLYLTNDATPVDLGPYLTNIDQQDLSLSGDTLWLSNDPTPVILGLLPGVDTQDLSFSNDTLFLTNDATPVGLKAFLDADTLGNHIATQNIQLNSHWLSGDGGNEGVQIDANGQVGIGTPAPQAPFHVALNPGEPGFQVTDSALIFNAYRIPLTDGTVNQVLTTDGAGKLSWTDQLNTDDQDLSLSGQTLSLSNDATTVDLSAYLDNTDQQDLSLSMDSLSLTNDGTKIDLSSYHNTDEQDLSLSNDSLFLTGDASPVSLEAYRQDLSLLNDSLLLTNDATPVDLSAYRQDMSFVNDSLFLTQSNPIDLRVFNQGLSYANDSLFISGQPGGVDLSGYLNTDNQDLSLDGNILNLTNDGTSVDMAAFPIVDDQQLSLSNDTLYLSNDPTPVYIGHYKDADSLGNHIATQNLRLNNKWLSSDGNDEGIYVANNGYVGVGEQPGSPFHVKMNGNAAGFRLHNHTVGIGVAPTAPFANYSIQVIGNASKTVAGAWLANSDARLKKNIDRLNAQNTLQQLLSLKGTTYQWNDNKTGIKRPEGKQYGFMAQNIQDVFPTLVSNDPHGYLQTSYGTLDAMKVEAIRALNEQIKILKNQNEALQTELELQDANSTKLALVEAQLKTELTALEKELAELQQRKQTKNNN